MVNHGASPSLEPLAAVSSHAGAQAALSAYVLLQWGNSLDMREKLFTLLDLCVSSLRRGHANLLCVVPTMIEILILI